MSEVYQRQIILPVTAAEAYAWHNRPGAIHRLMPPWERAKVVREVDHLRDGAQAEFAVQQGPVWLTWLAEHYAVDPPHQFRDRQLRGPFRHWDHLHHFQDVAELRQENDHPPSTDHARSACQLTDRVEYGWPGGAWTGPVVARWLRRKVDRMFAYRHATTLADLRLHQRYKEQGMKTISVTGASGLVGSALVPLLTTGGHRVVAYQRGQGKVGPGVTTAPWNPLGGTIDKTGLASSDVVVHLAGENIAARRWNAATKELIRRSRVDGTHLVACTMASLPEKPRTLICASAIGFYGDRADQVLDETSAAGEGFLADTCQAWEEAARPALDAGIRVVNLRFGIILSRQGGALQKMLLPFQLGAGGVIGSGEQYWSWIALEDAVRAILHAIMTPELRGPVNVVAPHPVTNREFTKTLGSVLHRPTLFPMPAFAARLAFGEMADHLMLASARVLPTMLQRSNFEYRYPQLAEALA